jgi:hypothetical protein
MAGVPLPITTHILQALVTEPIKAFLDVIVVSSQMHVYVSQTDRGEILIGAEIEPYTTYRMTSTFPFLEYSARHTLELFPQLESVNESLQPEPGLQPHPRSKAFSSAAAGERTGSSGRRSSARLSPSWWQRARRQT